MTFPLITEEMGMGGLYRSDNWWNMDGGSIGTQLLPPWHRKAMGTSSKNVDWWNQRISRENDGKEMHLIELNGVL